MRLPQKWLRSEWVEAIATKQGQPFDDGRIYNTDAIDKADLFLWIRKNYFPDLSPQQYRIALRGMCREQRPGYSPSPLNAELCKLHRERIATLGKRKWGFQVNLSHKVAASKNQASAAVMAKLGLELCNHEKTGKPHLANAVPDGATANPVILQHANQPRNGTPSTSAALGTGFNTTNAPSVSGPSEMPLDLEVDFAHVFDTRPDEKQQSPPGHARSIQQPSVIPEIMASVLPQTMSEEHLSVFNSGVNLLQYRCMRDVPEECYFDLERSFTQCFSTPDGVSFLIQETDRFSTGRADPYANQQAQHLFAVNLTQQQHILMGQEATRQVFGNLAQTLQTNATLAYTPGVWINTRDSDGNPCPRLADIWMPRVLFNGNMYIVMAAPTGAVSLEQAFPI